MPVNLLTDACICKVRGALVFWSPASAHLNAGVPRTLQMQASVSRLTGMAWTPCRVGG